MEPGKWKARTTAPPSGDGPQTWLVPEATSVTALLSKADNLGSHVDSRAFHWPAVPFRGPTVTGATQLHVWLLGA